jgi:hypothetical protein
MNPLTQNPKLTPGRFRVGDRVRILHGFRGTEGAIVEDRGPLGVHAERIYTVTIKMDEWNDLTTELRESDIEPVSQEKEPGNPTKTAPW